ncbi:aldose epimerase family protein [Humibacillus xanthopallidus]|uniref:Aldose 1-epimerase n=1 Tax=Humibacillus xanthopallidus TaxID=412689 RepID=A0A543HUL7_9MICO|nr:aldose epimerase family protein [Humibacillus xanthopallidus]TQM62036.1 aldose 1-epimerase [Humibacillus xanthopallidus]
MSADVVPPTSIELRAEGIFLEVLTAGAAVRRLEVPGADGRPVGVVLGHADTRTYVTAGGYLGATIGRFGNRIAGASFELGGTTHRLTANEGTTTLHGGVDGFDHRPWSVVDQSATSVRFGLHSPDGDQGFPGALDVTVTYAVAPGEVRIDYTATTDRETLVNLTNHSYFNLDGEGSGPVDDHELTLSSGRFTPTDTLLIPTGERRAVDGTPFDFRAPRRIGEALAHRDEQLDHGQGLDHNFVVDGEGLRHVATLRGRSGRTLDIESDQPGVQVYTGAHFDGTVIGTSGTAYGPRSGIALETQGFPDAPHHADFPSTVLEAGETLRSTTVWRLR